MIANAKEMHLNYTRKQNRLSKIAQNINLKKIRSFGIQLKDNKSIILSKSEIFSMLPHLKYHIHSDNFLGYYNFNTEHHKVLHWHPESVPILK